MTTTTPTLLKILLAQRHLQKYEAFRAEYEKIALQVAPELRGSAPSRAQYYRWLTGQLKGGTPYPDACRVLEGMFPQWGAVDLFGPSPTRPLVNNALTSVTSGCTADLLQGPWLTSYRFSRDQSKRHVDIAHVEAVSDTHLIAKNGPPEPRTEGHVLPFRNVIEARLTSRHLVGQWKNTNDTRYFGTLHLAVLPSEVVMEGYYTGLASDIEVSMGQWKWIRLDPLSLADVDLAAVKLREPGLLDDLISSYTQYDAPLLITAVVEEGPR
jgi:hypothetical protein